MKWSALRMAAIARDSIASNVMQRSSARARRPARRAVARIVTVASAARDLTLAGTFPSSTAIVDDLARFRDATPSGAARRLYVWSALRFW
ncbi:hypothetical protein AC628_14950 [Bradyrhizobium sp. NAS96.2]|nr:hypothetical protein AC628_14950 [Bradyrhizobium sp. NAS96.2]